MSETPYGERRNTSTRFLPPDPAVAAPYRLTPGLALRVGVLGVVALAIFAVQALVAASAVAPRERLRAAFRRG